jgi:thioredoxin 1
MVKEVNDNNFSGEIACVQNKVVVEFGAPWCKSCKMLTPIIEELDKEMMEVKFIKISTGESPTTTALYHITTLPTILIFYNASLKASLTGFKPKQYIKKVIENIDKQI